MHLIGKKKYGFLGIFLICFLVISSAPTSASIMAGFPAFFVILFEELITFSAGMFYYIIWSCQYDIRLLRSFMTASHLFACTWQVPEQNNTIIISNSLFCPYHFSLFGSLWCWHIFHCPTLCQVLNSFFAWAKQPKKFCMHTK